MKYIHKCFKRIMSILIVNIILLSNLNIVVEAADSKIESALQWAINIANDNSHGYSQHQRYGNPDYDCSSLVAGALKSVGFNVTWFATANMGAQLVNIGFNRYSFTSLSNCQRGDILWRSGHTEMYLGDGKSVGAHMGYYDIYDDAYPGDQTGNEISVANCGSNWTYYYRYGSSGNNPIGYLDSVTGGPGYIAVSGWAFDQDSTSTALSVHVYIGGPAGSGEGHIITANTTRTDVNNVYGCGNNHGFEATIPTDKTGSQAVYVYAINVGSGNDNTLLENSPKTATISKKLVHTVAYNANGGTGAPTSQTKTSGVQLNLSTTKPTRYCYNFVKWNTKANGTGTSYAPGANYTPDQDGGTVTLYAIWTPYKHTVAYNANGGTGAPASQTKTADVQLNLSTTKPTRYCYNFVKWNTKANGTGTSYAPGANYTPDQDGGTVTLYAIWTPYKHTVAYNANGGTGAPASQTKTADVQLNLSTIKPTRTGYTFVKWNTKADGSGTSYNPGANYTPDQNGGTVTLYAIWTANTYTVSYNANGGSGAPSSQTKTYGKSLTLSSTKPTRTGYTFVKWNTKADGSGTSYSAGGTYTANSGATLYAIWTANTYTVTYNANGGSGAPSSQTKTYGKSLTLSSTKPTRTGYTFAKWNTKADGSGTSYSAGGTYTANSDVVLYAIWSTSNTYTITYNSNGGTGTPPTQIVVADTTGNFSAKLSSIKPTRTGYTFVNWNTKADGTGTSYSPGDSYVIKNSGNITLYAIWTADDKLALNIGGGSGIAGGYVDIPVKISNNSGIATYTIAITYDNSIMYPVSYTKSNGFSDMISTLDSGSDMSQLKEVKFVWDSLSNISGDYSLFTVKFKIMDNVKSGNYSIGLNQNTTIFANSSLNDVLYSVILNNIVIGSILKGDVNKDGIVNGKDVVLLRQYVAGFPSATLTSEQIDTGDVTGDGLANGKDIVKIRQYIAGFPGITL